VKQALFAYVNHARICSWYQPVLSNENKVSCSRKQRGLWWGSNESDKLSTVPCQYIYIWIFFANLHQSNTFCYLEISKL